MECMKPEINLVPAAHRRRGRLAVGCASSGAVPRPFPTPGQSPRAWRSAPPPDAAGPTPGGGSPVEADGYTLSSTALALRGAPYRNGGTSPDGFDCSGFVQYVFGQHGLTMPRETREQFRVGRSIRRNDLAPGDLVFFTTDHARRLARGHRDRSGSVRPRSQHARRRPRRTPFRRVLGPTIRRGAPSPLKTSPPPETSRCALRVSSFGRRRRQL